MIKTGVSELFLIPRRLKQRATDALESNKPLRPGGAVATAQRAAATSPHALLVALERMAAPAPAPCSLLACFWHSSVWLQTYKRHVLLFVRGAVQAPE